ncbi:MAG: ABC transporter substrate-binding protein [Chloroflexota bacterium]
MEILETQSDPNTHGMSRREALRRGLLGGAGLASLGSISSVLALADAHGVSAHELDASKGKMAKLIKSAKKEGKLNTIALPPDWADYGEIISKFQTKYGISITNTNPNGSSGEEIQALVSLKGQSRAPDVVDVGPSFADQGKTQNLFIPYKVSTWKTIPTNMKDPSGHWFGDYWGAQSFITNLNVAKQAPKDFSDLTSPKLKGMVALDNDPRSATDAFSAVFAASLANGGSLNNIEPGIEFFAKLKRLGNFITAAAHTAQIVQGATPIAIKWDYLNLADKVGNPNVKLAVTVPKHGAYGGYYCQAISTSAPNPAAAKLWMEYLYSDEGQILFLKGFTHPARYLDLAKRGKIPKALAKRLPPASSYKHVKFASLSQIAAAAQVMKDQWGPKVLGT